MSKGAYIKIVQRCSSAKIFLTTSSIDEIYSQSTSGVDSFFLKSKMVWPAAAHSFWSSRWMIIDEARWIRKCSMLLSRVLLTKRKLSYFTTAFTWMSGPCNRALQKQQRLQKSNFFPHTCTSLSHSIGNYWKGNRSRAVKPLHKFFWGPWSYRMRVAVQDKC